MAPPSTGTPCGVDPKLGKTVHRFDPTQRQCRCGGATTPDVAMRKGRPNRVHPKYANLVQQPTGRSWGHDG